MVNILWGGTVLGFALSVVVAGLWWWSVEATQEDMDSESWWHRADVDPVIHVTVRDRPYDWMDEK
jgi:hypothetical protein